MDTTFEFELGHVLPGGREWEQSSWNWVWEGSNKPDLYEP